MIEYLPYLTTIGSVIAFVFTVLKYLDSKKQQEKNARFKQFHKIFEWVSGRTAEGQPLVDTQQAIAIYQLSEFKEYSYMTLPIINYYLDKSKDEPDDTLFRSALLESKHRLSSEV